MTLVANAKKSWVFCLMLMSSVAYEVHARWLFKSLFLVSDCPWRTFVENKVARGSFIDDNSLHNLQSIIGAGGRAQVGIQRIYAGHAPAVWKLAGDRDLYGARELRHYRRPSAPQRRLLLSRHVTRREREHLCHQRRRRRGSGPESCAALNAAAEGRRGRERGGGGRRGGRDARRRREGPREPSREPRDWRALGSASLATHLCRFAFRQRCRPARSQVLKQWVSVRLLV